MSNPFQLAARKIEALDKRSATAVRIRSEGRIVGALIAAILVSGDNVISVHDGEEFALRRSNDAAAILAATFSTDADTLVVRDAATRSRLGSFDLVYGNDGFDVVSDHSDNAYCDSIMAAIAETIAKEEQRAAFA